MADKKVGAHATELVKDEIKDCVRGKVTSVFMAWFLKALPGLAVAGVTGAVAGGVTAVVVSDSGDSSAKKKRTADDGDKPSPVDFAGAGTGEGTLNVTSDPAGGRVVVDGRLVGKTPVERLFAATGKHAVVVELDGYESFVGDATVEAGKPTSVNATLVAMKDQGKKKKTAGGGGGGGGYREPKKPWLNCSGKKQDCVNRCGSVEFSCQGRCHCQDKPQDECRAIMDSCYSICKENRLGCEDQCEAAEDQCDEMSGPP